MNREELIALRDAIDLALALPDSVRALFAQWLTPEIAQPNGRDPHSAVAMPPPPPRTVKTNARRVKLSSAKTAERRLLTVLQESPGLSVAAFAKAVSAGRSTTGERLRQLAIRGAIDKDADGRWKLKGAAVPAEAGEEARPT